MEVLWNCRAGEREKIWVGYGCDGAIVDSDARKRASWVSFDSSPICPMMYECVLEYHTASKKFLIQTNHQLNI